MPIRARTRIDVRNDDINFLAGSELKTGATTTFSTKQTLEQLVEQQEATTVFVVGETDTTIQYHSYKQKEKWLE